MSPSLCCLAAESYCDVHIRVWISLSGMGTIPLMPRFIANCKVLIQSADQLMALRRCLAGEAQ